MSAAAKTGLKWVAGIAVGVLFVWLAALDWPLDKLFAEEMVLDGSMLRAGSQWRFDLWYLVPYLLVLSAIHFLRVIRWYPLLRPIAYVDFWRLNRVSAVGFMYLFVLPLRLGELARPYLIADRGDVKMTEALATVVVERVVDGLIVSVALFFVLFFLPGEGADSYAEIRYGAWLAAAIFGGAMAVLALAYWRRSWTLDMLDAIIGRVSTGIATKIRGILESFFHGLDALPNARYFLSFLLYSVVYWALNGYGYYVLAQGFPDLEVPLLAAYAMMCCVVVGMMLPNPPANVGVFWYFLLKPLALYGVVVGDPTATAFGLLAWTGQFVQQGAFGLYYLVRPGAGAGELASLRDRRKASREPRHGTPQAQRGSDIGSRSAAG